MSQTVVIVAYSILIGLASLIGGWLPGLIQLNHLRRQLILSLVSGVMLGVALLHLLPHAVEHSRSLNWAAGSMLCGVLMMFFLLRMFHVHHHSDEVTGDAEHVCHGHRNRLSWIGLFVGLVVHSLLDGVALAASVVAEASVPSPLSLFGLGTFLAVVLHKPLDALSITSLMGAGGWTSRSQAIVNGGFALMCPAGALCFWLGLSQLEGQNAIVGAALGFSAGFFVCIALSDLLPEVAFHSHDRLKLSATLLFGIAIAAGIEFMHAGNSHGHPHDGHSHYGHHHHSHDGPSHEGPSHDGPSHRHAHDHQPQGPARE